MPCLVNRGRAFQLFLLAVALTLLWQSPIFLKISVITRMSGAQSYIIRLLRKVETRLNEENHLSEASNVGKIVQKLAQAEDIRAEMSALYAVERFDQFALRLMWLLDEAERDNGNFENGVLEFHTSWFTRLILEVFRTNSDGGPADPVPMMLSDQIDELYIGLHKFGRSLEELKRQSSENGTFLGIQESQLYKILSDLASLKEHAIGAAKDDVAKFAEACGEFIQYVLDNGLLSDVRIINILDNSNITLQTVFESAGVEDNDSLQSTIDLLKRPKDLLDQ